MGGDNQYRYYSREQLPLLRRIVFLRGLGIGLEVIRDLLRAGTLDDPTRLRAILEEHAAGIHREMEAQRERLGEIERLSTLLAREGEAGAVGTSERAGVISADAATSHGVVVKRVPEIRAAGIRRAIHLRDLDALFREAERTLTRPAAGPPICVYYNPEFDPEFVDVEVLFPTELGAPIARGHERVCRSSPSRRCFRSASSR